MGNRQGQGAVAGFKAGQGDGLDAEGLAQGLLGLTLGLTGVGYPATDIP